MNVITTMSSSSQRNVSFPSNLGPIRRPKQVLSEESSSPQTTTANVTNALISNPSNFKNNLLIDSSSNGTTTPTSQFITSSPSSSDINFMKDFLNLLRELNTKLRICNQTNEFSNLLIERNMIIDVCSLLKMYGSSIDSGSNQDFKSLLDSFFTQLTHLIDTNQLDIVTRGHVLHVLELRNNRWQTSSSSSSVPNSGTSSQSTAFNTGAISKTKPTVSSNHGHGQGVDTGHKQVQWQQQVLTEVPSGSEQIPSPASSDEKIKIDRNHHYLKGELLIRNCDSGKVMGVKGRRVRMIEELSDTIISFQKVNKDDRDRRLQITGSNALCIETAKRLIIDTIRRNASPVPPVEDDVDPLYGDAYGQPVSGPLMTSHQPFTGHHDPTTSDTVFKKGLQKSSSLGITLKPKADGLFTSSLRPCLYDTDDVIYMSSNNSLLLNEALQVLSIHLDQRRKQVEQRNALINNSLVNNSPINNSLVNNTLINNTLINNNPIKQQQLQQIHSQMLKKKRMNLLSGPSLVHPGSESFPTGSGSIGGIGNIGSVGSGLGVAGHTTRFGSSSYDDLMRLSLNRSHLNLNEEDEEECDPTVSNDYKYFNMGIDTGDKPGLNRIKSVLSSSCSHEQTSPLFGDFLHRDSLDLTTGQHAKSGIAQVKAVKKSASSNTLYRQSSTIQTSLNPDDPLINLDTSSPWNRVSPFEPSMVKKTFEPGKEALVVPTAEGGSKEVAAEVRAVPRLNELKPLITYDKLTLIKLSKSDASRGFPINYESMKSFLPDIMI